MGREALSHVLLEHVFQRELQLPWGIRDAGYRSVSRGIDVGIARTRKVGQVGDVERLEAELELRPFCDVEFLEERHIDFLVVRGVASVYAGITIGEGSGHCIVGCVEGMS